MQAQPEELKYNNWWAGVACKWPGKMEIICTQKIVGKRTRILQEIEENEEIRSRMNFYLLVVYFLTIVSLCLKNIIYHFFYSLCTLYIANLGW